MARPALDTARIDPLVVRMYTSGTPVRLIARSVGISERSVHYALRRLGLGARDTTAQSVAA